MSMNMKKWIKQFLCRHNKLEAIVAKESDSRSYEIHCPQCGQPITIHIVGYSLTTQPQTTKGFQPCPKKLYLTKKDAETVVNWCTVQRFYKQPLRMYYCEREKGWHLTKRPKYKSP